MTFSVRPLGVAAALAISACSSSSDVAEDRSSPSAVAATTAPAASSSAEPAAEPTTSDASTTTVAPSAVATTVFHGAVPSDLVGRWAHYDVVAYQDGLLKTLIISYGFNDITEVDGQLFDQASFCYSDQRTDQPIDASLSDAGTQAIKPPLAPLDVTVDDGELQIRRDPTPTPVGIELDDPFNDPLPTDRNDPRVIDADGDGNPGITVEITVTEDVVGELYIARREIFAYDATLVGADRIEGFVTDDSEQLVLGASDPVFDQGEANWVQFRDPDRNPIILQRVTDDWDCERLRAERDNLFPPTPEVDW